MNEKRLASKQNTVSEVSSKMQDNAATVVFKYEGLTVKEFQALRTDLREIDVEVKVLKNNFTRRAAVELGHEQFNEAVVGPNAVAFAKEEGVSLLKVLKKYKKDTEKVDYVAGIFDGEYADNEKLEMLSNAMTRDEALATFAAMLLSPIQGFAIATKEIAALKEAE